MIRIVCMQVPSVHVKCREISRVLEIYARNETSGEESVHE